MIRHNIFNAYFFFFFIKALGMYSFIIEYYILSGPISWFRRRTNQDGGTELQFVLHLWYGENLAMIWAHLFLSLRAKATFLVDSLNQCDLKSPKGGSNNGQQVAKSYPEGGSNTPYIQALPQSLKGPDIGSNMATDWAPKLGPMRLSAKPNKGFSRYAYRSYNIAQIGSSGFTQTPTSVSGISKKRIFFQNNIN